MAKRLERPSEKIHVTLFTDQLERAKRYHPKVTTSELLRLVLDKYLDKVEAQVAAKVARMETKDVNGN